MKPSFNVGQTWFLINTLLALASVPVSAEKAWEEPLHDALVDQHHAIILLNDAMLARDGTGRAALYRDHESGIGRMCHRIMELQQRLSEVEKDYALIHQAHGLPLRSRDGEDIPVSKAAQALAHDPAALPFAEASFIETCSALRSDANAIRAEARALLESLRDGEKALQPRFEARPAVMPDEDGRLDGLVISVQSDPEAPGSRLLGVAYKTSYEAYDRGYPVPPTELHDSLGLQTLLVVPCSVHRWTYCDPQWFEEHADLPITRPSAPRYEGKWMFELDFRHPEVVRMMETYLLGVAKTYRGDQRIMAYLTAWEPQGDEGGSVPWGHWSTGGRTPAGQSAFRDRMRAKFETIEMLNEAWGAEYDSFDSIVPPPDVHVGADPERAELVQKLFSGECPPLHYEFNRFLRKSYAEYLAWCHRVLKKADPTHPTGISPTYGEVDGYLGVGRDSFLWADIACDMYGSELNSSLDEVVNWSVARASGKVNAIFECIWNGFENWNQPGEEVTRAVARRNLWRMTAWGRRIMDLYGHHDTYGGNGHNNMMVYETDYRLMRRSAGVIEPLRRKLRAAEDVWFGAPIVEPDIAVIKPTTSQICSWQWEAVTRVMGRVHELLYGRNYHYVIIPEEHVVSRREPLSQFKAIVLPNASHFPPGLTDRLLPWVEQGGTLISVGIAGGFTPYGEEDGALMNELFGPLTYQPWFEYGESGWLLRIPELAPDVHVDGKKLASVLSSPHGAGRALLINDLQLSGENGDRLCEWIDRSAPRRAWVGQNALEMNLRENDDGLFITLINPDLHDVAAATVHVTGTFSSAIDRGIEGGWPVPLERKDEMTSFKTMLAPGEGTLIHLRQPANPRPSVETEGIMCIGDSITAGTSTDPESRPYPTVLETLLGGRHAVENRSVPGAKTTSMVEDVRSRARERSPDIVVILAGVNDINVWDERQGSLYGPGAVIERLRGLGVVASGAGARTIYATFWPDSDFSEAKIDAVRKVNAWILKRAPYEVPNASSLDLMQVMTGHPGDQAALLLPEYHDGGWLHLNAAGHRQIAEAIAERIRD